MTPDALYSQRPEAQPSLGSHLDKSSPSGHCEGSGKEGSSVLVSTSRSREGRTALGSLSATTAKNFSFLTGKGGVKTQSKTCVLHAPQNSSLGQKSGDSEQPPL